MSRHILFTAFIMAALCGCSDNKQKQSGAATPPEPPKPVIGEQKPPEQTKPTESVKPIEPVKTAPPVGENPPAGIDAALWKTVDALVAKLGDDDYHTRGAAQKEIEALPASALDAVKASVERRSADAEIKLRGEKVVAALADKAFGEKAQKEFTNAIGMKLVLIPAGEFLMGSPETEQGRKPDESPQHKVRITKQFYIGATTVTKDQFAAFVHDISYRTEREKAGGASWSSVGFRQAGSHPVVNVSWNDAKAFCAWLSKKEGKEYRLPTEAEWEYACRAGTQTRFSFGNDDRDLYKYGNYCDKSSTSGLPWQDKAHNDGFDKTAPVGSLKSNDWGLYDMHGNVSQWCEDWHDKDYYQNSPAADPTGPAQGTERVVRGGAYDNLAGICRSAFRSMHKPDFGSSYFGFRVVLVSISKTP
jgi:formylglycine-generating enzyme required for sulfatase activity